MKHRDINQLSQDRGAQYFSDYFVSEKYILRPSQEHTDTHIHKTEI